MSNSIQDEILDRIRKRGRGQVFVPKDFLDLGSRDAADQALSRLVKRGDIVRVGRGLYHFPRINERLGIPLGPDLDEIAAALTRLGNTTIQIRHAPSPDQRRKLLRDARYTTDWTASERSVRSRREIRTSEWVSFRRVRPRKSDPGRRHEWHASIPR